MTGIARQTQLQVVHMIRATVNYNDSNIANGNVIGTLPKGAVILPLASTVVVSTAFNAATTNNLLIGTSAGGNDLATTSDTAAGSTGAKTLALATVGTGAKLAADKDIYVTYTQTGTAASAGVATVCIAYVCDNG